MISALNWFGCGFTVARFDNRDGAVAGLARIPFNEEAARRPDEHAQDRDHDFAPIEQQKTAVITSADLRPGLRVLPAPTLVPHGTADRAIRPAGRWAIADAFPHTRLILFPGMSHGPPSLLWPVIADEVTVHAQRYQPLHQISAEGGRQHLERQIW